MAVSYRRGHQGTPPRGTLAEARSRVRRPAPDTRPLREPPRARPATLDPREARCDVLARRIVILGALSLLMFIAGFFMSIPHAILCLTLPLSLAFTARHRLDQLQEELQQEGPATPLNKANSAPPLDRAS